MKYRALLAYDGSGYHGFQSQINGVAIQDLIEGALEKVHHEKTGITASGRTDAGVHATGQVFHFEGQKKIGCRGYYNALNTLLPKDIRIRAVQEVPEEFHARFSAVKKVYEYILTTNRDDPFSWRYKTPLRPAADVQKMEEASRVFVGSHDFTSFTHAKIHPDKPRVKTIEAIRFAQKGKDIHVTFEGDGFLRYQIRMMMAVLIRAAEGRLTTEDIADMLEARDKEASRYNAPAQGLYLRHALYPEDLEARCGACWPPEVRDSFRNEPPETVS